MTDKANVPYIPIWCRPPNKFIGMDTVTYDDGAGHRGILSVANFFDKKGKKRDIVARVKWIT